MGSAISGLGRKEKTGRLDDTDLQKVNRALNISFGLNDTY